MTACMHTAIFEMVPYSDNKLLEAAILYLAGRLEMLKLES